MVAAIDVSSTALYAPATRLVSTLRVADPAATCVADCLSPRELAIYEALYDRGRRRAWLAGRIAAKQLLLARVGRGPTATLRLCDLEIDSGGWRGGRQPRAYLAGGALPWSLSIAHSARHALVALTPARHAAIGVDLVPPREMSRGFLSVWFTSAEQAWLDAPRVRVPHAGMRPVAQDEALAAAWAVKEAAYKAAGGGRPFRPRQFEVLLHDERYVCRDATTGWELVREMHLWKTPAGEIAALAVADPQPGG